MKKRIAAMLLALVVFAGAAFPALGHRSLAAGSVYFTSVNDVLCPLDDGTMPFWSGGNLYVPGSVFSAYDLDISYVRDTSVQKEYLYNRTKIIEFDLANGGANNNLGTYYSASALLKNGTVYFPVAFVCSYFDLSYTIVETAWSPMVRITDDTVILSDEQFVDAATSLMSSRYTAYQQSKKPVPSNPDPVPPEDDETEEEDTDTKVTAKVFLALRGEDEQTLSAMLTVLDRYRYKATVFFDPEELQGYDDVLRRIVSTGHLIGFIQNEDGTALLEEGNAYLRKITGTTTRIVLPAEQALRADGYIPYVPTLQAEKLSSTASGQSGRLFDRIENSTGNVKILMGGDETASSALNTLCRKFYSNQYTVRAVNEVLCGK